MKEHSGLQSLLFKSTIHLNIPELHKYLSLSAKESIGDTIKAVFYIRHIKGCRRLGRHSYQWLFLNYPGEFMKVIRKIPEYGRWDDLLWLWPGLLQLNSEEVDFINRNYCSDVKVTDIVILQKYQNDIVRITGEKLVEDRLAMLLNQPVSLCAKWCPSEKDSLDRRYNLVRTLCKAMSWNKATYRKEYLTPLRKYTRIIEPLMCDNRWSEIDIERVPRCAMKKLKMTFRKRLPANLEYYEKYCKYYKQPSSYEFMGNIYSYTQNEWNNILEMTDKTHGTISVIDISSSMKKWNYSQDYDFNPVDVSVGIGILLANTLQGYFKNKFITFSHNPEILTLSETDNVFEHHKHVTNSDWSTKLDISSVLDILLYTAISYDVTKDEFPRNLLVITDASSENASSVINESIFSKYKKSIYLIPHIKFWNLGSNNHMSDEREYVTEIAGFSHIFVKPLITSNKFELNDIIKDILKDY
tara:strand:+ start:2034 stop:3443 length:1410 start_codon:yes stop_codon:yes gene_type:complete